MKTLTTQRDYNILRWILLTTKMYIETLFIIWLLTEVFAPMTIPQSAFVVVMIVLALEYLTRPISKAIRNSYEIVEEQNEPARHEQTVIVVQRNRVATDTLTLEDGSTMDSTWDGIL